MSSIFDHRIKSISRFIFVNILRNFLGILRGKEIALLFGAEGIGLLGQFLTFFNFQSKLLMFGVTASLVNSVNLGQNRGYDRDKIILVNLLLVFVANIIFGSIYFCNIDLFSILLFTSVKYTTLIILTGILGFIYSISTFFELIFQADQNFKLLSYGRIISIIVSILLVVPLIYKFGVNGAILNLIILSIVSLLYFLFNGGLNKVKISLIDFKKEFPIIKNILLICFTDILRSFSILGSLMIGRILIIHLLGIKANGFYQSIWSISNYIDILLQGFVVYYYPKISSIFEDEKINDEININFEVISYLIFPFILLITVWPQIFLWFFYSEEFISFHSFLSLVMIAKIFNFFYYFYSITLLGKNFLKKYIFLDLSRSLIFILVNYFLIKLFSFNGAIYAIIITELLSFVFVIFLIKEIKYIHLNKSNKKLFFKILLFTILLFILPIPLLIKTILIFIIILIFFDIKKYSDIIKSLIFTNS